MTTPFTHVMDAIQHADDLHAADHCSHHVNAQCAFMGNTVRITGYVVSDFYVEGSTVYSA